MAEIIFNLGVIQDNNLRIVRFQKSLNGTSYTFKIKYQKRIDAWLMSIDDKISEIPIFGGVDLLKQLKHLAVPLGTLEAIDIDGFNRDPTETNFGKEVVLKYTEVL